MSDTEAVMWRIEKDPRLNPNGGVVVIVDQPIDAAHFRRNIAYAISKIDRLRERVAAPLAGPLEGIMNPRWVRDPEFEFDWHVRHVALPRPGTRRQLFDLCARLHSDPYDRTRPLWQFVIIDGLEDGRGALFWKLHHALMDGRGALRLTELFMDQARDTPPRPSVDVDDPGSVRPPSPTPGPLAAARRMVTELTQLGSEPGRLAGLGRDLLDTASTVASFASDAEDLDSSGSTLWSQRSRFRRFDMISFPLEEIARAARAAQCSINDVFVTAAINGVVQYHHTHDAALTSLTFSFVVSTRTDKAVGGNAFTPVVVHTPVEDVDPATRLSNVKTLLDATKADTGRRPGGLERASGLAKLLPVDVITTMVRRQAARVDFATSNMRGAPFPVFIAGARIEHNLTIGPVSGTAFNLTALSQAGCFDMGLHIDTAAVAHPDALRECIEHGFVGLGITPPTTHSTARSADRSTATKRRKAAT